MPSLSRPVRRALRRRGPRRHHDIDRLTRPRARRPTRRSRGPLQQLLVPLTVLALLPLWPFIAYPLQRVQPPSGPRTVPLRSPAAFVHRVTHHSVVIALSAPMRFLADRLHRGGPGRGRDGWGPPSAGDREPRRPKSGPPVDSIALTEPRA
jgi:hypothetical protein